MNDVDFQKMLNVMSDQDKRTRSRYHLTLGGLIAALEGVPAGRAVRFDTGEYPETLGSYRGYYEDLALGLGDKPRTAGGLLDDARCAVKQTFHGYKGGDFVMDENTPLWAAEYGSCGRAIVSASVEDGAVILHTKEID